jgi:hypothetical protein
MFFGLPFRTRNTMVDVYGVLLFGSRFCQPLSVRPALAIASTSKARASVTTSASSPSITARAWLPEPPWDARTVTVCPVLFFQYFSKAALNSR